jgi:formate C-acetyltransferase
MEPIIVNGELIVGQPDFSPLTPDEEAAMYVPCDMPGSPGRHDHMALDFEKLLRLGVNGLIAEIEQKNAPDNVFYSGALEELHALLRLANRYADTARAMGMADVADILSKVPANPASTFREALQSIHFYSFALWGLYQTGRPDRYLYPYYRRDIDAGVLTPEEAQELIDCFCLLYTTYITSCSSVGFMIGGVDPDGNPVENELTWHFLYSIGHTRTADPSIGLCVNEHTSPDLLHAAARLIAAGHTHPAFYGDRLIIDSLIAHGYDIRAARDYIHSC